MRIVELSGAEVPGRVKLTDPLLKLEMDFCDGVLSALENGSLPAPFVLPDGDAYLVFNGNHRCFFAGKAGRSVWLNVIETQADPEQAERLGSRLTKDEPVELAYVLDCLRIAAREHNHQWGWDWSC